MTETGNKAMVDDDRALEELLGRASPRQAPPADVNQRVKAAVREEWRKEHRRNAMRRRTAMFAAAASVVLAVAVVWTTWLAPLPPPVQVATLEKSMGTIYLLSEQAELRRAENLRSVQSGQTIVTAENASVGLRWNHGGSLRLDANTEVLFAAKDSIELRSGRVYFDSLPDSGAKSSLKIRTEHGDVAHIGTQFMTAVDDDSLIVSVREGKVSIDGRFYDDTVEAGNQARLVGSRRPEILSIRTFGPEWEWIEATAPIAVMQGKSLYDFLLWISRETGLEVRFESDEVERVAREESPKGDLDETPRVALRQSLLSADLAYDIDNGVIRIRNR